jgi:hypothetical protein
LVRVALLNNIFKKNLTQELNGSYLHGIPVSLCRIKWKVL